MPFRCDRNGLPDGLSSVGYFEQIASGYIGEPDSAPPLPSYLTDGAVALRDVVGQVIAAPWHNSQTAQWMSADRAFSDVMAHDQQAWFVGAVRKHGIMARFAGRPSCEGRGRERFDLATVGAQHWTDGRNRREFVDRERDTLIRVEVQQLLHSAPASRNLDLVQPAVQVDAYVTHAAVNDLQFRIHDENLCVGMA